MRLDRRIVLVMLLVTSSAGVATAEGTRGNVHFVLGQRSLDTNAFWDDGVVDLDSQSAFGVNLDFGNDDWPVQLALGFNFAFASDDVPAGDDIASFTGEVSLGMRWVANRNGDTRPYIGAGLSTIGVVVYDDDSMILLDDSESEQTFGFYANAGIYWRLGSRLNVGFDGRLVRGTEIDFGTVETDVDYEQFGFSIGFGW